MARAVAGNRANSGSDQRLMYDQSWRPATDGTTNRSLHHAPDRTSNRGILWPIVRTLVISCDGACDRTINCCYLRPIVRSFVVPTVLESQVTSFEHDHRPCCDWFAHCDHPRPLRPVVCHVYDLSTIPNCFGRSSVVTWSWARCGWVWTWRTTLLRLILPGRSPTASATSRTSFLLFAHDSNIFRSQVGRNLVVSPVWPGL